jgi:hypothetical protein
MQEHHVGGRRHDPLTIPLCMNCHTRLSRCQSAWPEEWTLTDKPRAVVMALILRGISDVLMLISRKLREMSEEILHSWRKS